VPLISLHSYDVFLVQGRGSRRWHVEMTPRGAEDEALVPALDVRVLASFLPTASATLQPGDALYLPPR
jgi:50S ribosomal protein L16 3-hydroxylase